MKRVSASTTTTSTSSQRTPRRRRRPEARLLPIGLGLWIVGLIAFVGAFALGNTGVGSTMAATFVAGIVIATLAEVGAFLVVLASAVSHRPHRPWNLIALPLVVLISPATGMIAVMNLLTL